MARAIYKGRRSVQWCALDCGIAQRTPLNAIGTDTTLVTTPQNNSCISQSFSQYLLPMNSSIYHHRHVCHQMFQPEFLVAELILGKVVALWIQHPVSAVDWKRRIV